MLTRSKKKFYSTAQVWGKAAGGGGAFVTWETATVANATLSGGNLTATNTGTTSADQGARVAAANGKTTGKYYFEVTNTTTPAGGNVGAGVCTTASTYTGMGGNATAGGEVYYNSGNIWANGSNTGFSLGGALANTTFSVAVDLTAHKIWFRKGAGTWAGSSDPETGTGGFTIPTGTMVPIVTFGGTGGAAGNVLTANFGASAFVRAVPAGFTSGWPV